VLGPHLGPSCTWPAEPRYQAERRLPPLPIPFLILCSRKSCAGTARRSFLHYTQRSHRRRVGCGGTALRNCTGALKLVPLLHSFTSFDLDHSCTTLTLFYTLGGLTRPQGILLPSNVNKPLSIYITMEALAGAIYFV